MAENPDLGIVIGAVGADLYTQELKRVKDATDKAFNSLAGSSKKGSEAVKALGQQFPVLGRVASFATNPITLAVSAVAGLGVGFIKATKSASSFNNEFLQLQNLNLGATAGQLAGLRDTVLDTAIDTGRGAEEISKAFFDIQSGTNLDTAGIKSATTEIANFATATGADFTVLVDGAVKQLRAFGLGAEDINDVLASQFAVIDQGITTFEDYAKVQVEFAGASASAGQSVDSANSIFAAFTATAKSSRIAATLTKQAFIDLGRQSTIDGLKSIGVEFFDTEGKARDVRDVVTDLVPVLQGLNDAEFATLKENIGGSEGIRGLLDNARNSGNELLGVFDEFKNAKDAFDLEDLLKNAQGDFQTLSNIARNQLNTVLIQLGQLTLPNLARILNVVGNGIQAVSRFVNENSQLIKALGAGVVTAVAVFGAWKIASIALRSAIAFGPVVSAVTTATIALSTALISGTGIIGGATIAVRAFATALNVTPLGLFATALGVAVTALLAFRTEAEESEGEVLSFVETLGLIDPSTQQTVDNIGIAFQKVRTGASTSVEEIAKLETALADVNAQIAEAVQDQGVGAVRLTVSDEDRLTTDELVDLNKDEVIGELEGLRSEIEQGIYKIRNIQKTGNKPIIDPVPVAGSVDAISAKIADLTKQLNEDVPAGSQGFIELTREINQLNEVLDLANERTKALTGGIDGIDTQAIAGIGTDLSQPLRQLREESEGIGESLEGATTPLERFLGNLSAQGADITGLAEDFEELGATIKGVAVDALGQFAFGIGEAIGQGSGFKDVLIDLGRSLLVEVPKYIGLFLLQTGVGLGFPAGAPFILGGVALLGASGIASGLLNRAGGSGGGEVTPISNTGGVDIAQSRDLSSFSGGAGGGQNVNVFIDGREISSIIKNRIDIESELQLGG